MQDAPGTFLDGVWWAWDLEKNPIGGEGIGQGSCKERAATLAEGIRAVMSRGAMSLAAMYKRSLATSTRRVSRGLLSTRIGSVPRRWESSDSSYSPGPAQKVGADSVNFPGALNSKFTATMKFQNPAEETALATYRYMDADGNIVDTERQMTPVTDEEVVKWYRNMLTVSIMDLIMFDAQRQGRTSFYMVSAGEEGIAVGSAAALSPGDVCFLQYREQGVLVQRGFTLKEIMSQLFSNKDDHGKGRNMPVHYGSSKLNVHTISSTLATQIPHASGAAYALKMQSLIDPNVEKRIVACYFGEGAASEGDFHAALNIAATKSCPVVFVCRNNGFAISTASIEQYKGDGIASRGLGYGIDTIRVDGNDIFAVREVMLEARKRALEGNCKPILIEAMSYRVSHHSTSDDSFAYRAKREVEEWKRRDNPVTRLRKWLENKGLWSDDMEKEARASIRKEVLQEFAAAEKLKKPPIKALWEDVYAEIIPEQQDQINEMKRIIEKYPNEYDVKSYEGGLKSLD